jgi:hypothetical protein
MTEPEDLEVQDTSGLTDADWVEINKLRKVYKKGGRRTFKIALDRLVTRSNKNLPMGYSNAAPGHVVSVVTCLEMA